MSFIPKNQRLFFVALASFLITFAVLLTVQKVSNPQVQTTQASDSYEYYDDESMYEDTSLMTH